MMQVQTTGEGLVRGDGRDTNREMEGKKKDNRVENTQRRLGRTERHGWMLLQCGGVFFHGSANYNKY